MSNISFVIPAYNTSPTLTASVDSIFAGNFLPGDEVIIVNDCSTDDTLKVAKELAKKYTPHITVISNPTNKGCPASRNVGITATKNPLIFNLDGDNILVPGSIEKLKTALVAEQADVVTFATYHYFINQPTHVTHYWHCRPGLFTLADLLAGHINPGPGGNYLYTKASWEKIGHYWEYGKGLHEAWGFTLKQLAAGARIVVVPDTYYLHRHGHASLFATESKVKAAEYDLTLKMIAPYRDLITPEDCEYIENTPSWQENLSARPIQLRGLSLGKNGSVTRTWYGLWQSLRHKLQL